MASNYPGNTIPILLYQNHTNIHAILSEINTLHYSSLGLCISKHPNRHNISFLRLFLLQGKQFRIRRRRKGHRSLKNSGIISGRSLLISVSFPQFFQEENRKSCCTANQNIVNGRKRNGENSARQHCSNDRQQNDRVEGISFNGFQHFQPGRENQIDHTYLYSAESTGNPCKA